MTKAASMSVPSSQVKAKKIPGNDNKTTIQVLGPTKHWLNQIIEERGVSTYDSAIMYLIEERQKHLPSGFGSRPDLEEYVCTGED